MLVSDRITELKYKKLLQISNIYVPHNKDQNYVAINYMYFTI